MIHTVHGDALKRELSAALTSVRNAEYARRITLDERDRLRDRVRDLARERNRLRERVAVAEAALTCAERRMAEMEARS